MLLNVEFVKKKCDVSNSSHRICLLFLEQKLEYTINNASHAHASNNLSTGYLF